LKDKTEKKIQLYKGIQKQNVTIIRMNIKIKIQINFIFDWRLKLKRKTNLLKEWWSDLI
jgi:hypothetical protein